VHSGQRDSGFTIIEVLVAITIFGILVLLIAGSMSGLFGLSGKNGSQVTATNLAQQVVEQVRGQWQNLASYNEACITTLPAGVTAPTVQDEDAQGNAVNASYSLNVKATCGQASPAAAQGSALRLVQVSVTSGKVTSALNIEIPRP
jgi:prepilin-type N-terminal cleavage/methylation domain-containing protein